MSKKLNIHQKHDKIKHELFRFVHVRKAGKSTKKEAPLTIIYDEKVLGKVRSNLFSKLCKLKNLTPQEAKVGLDNLLEYHASSPNLLDSETTLDTTYPGFAQFYSWSVGVKTEKVTTVTHKLESLTAQVVNDIVTNITLQSQAWDNYFYYILKGINAPMVQRLTEIIRVYEIAKELLKTKRKSINSLERANIVIPKCVMILLSIEDYWDDEHIANKNQKNKQEKKAPSAVSFTLNQLEQAKKELYNQSQIKTEAVKLKEEFGVNPEWERNIDKKTWERLGENTQEVLQAGNYSSDKATITEAINYINGQIRTVYKQAFSKTATSKKIVLIGSSLVEIKNTTENNKTETETRAKATEKSSATPTAQESILSMYNSYWQGKDAAYRLDIQIGDFKRVEQETKCYVPGEVAHIENILQGELKTRKTRRFTKTQETSYYESETTEENERDVQTTDRFEMEKETESVIATDTNIEAGFSMTGDYGVVQVAANAGFSFNLSTENSKRQATEYAKSITDRARNKIVKKTKETRTSTIIKEFEDKNNHTIDNSVDPKGNVVGIYRWVDKIYKASLVNYGRRMMIKFNLIEPSAYYQWSHISNPSAEINFPISPDKVAENVIGDGNWQNNVMLKLNSFKDINENNYDLWAAQYGASVEIPPKEWIHIEKGYIKDKGSEDEYFSSTENLRIPAGYDPEWAFARAAADPQGNAAQFKLSISIGQSLFKFDNIQSDAIFWTGGALNYLNEEENIPVTIFGVTKAYAATVIIRCKLNANARETWQKETYEAIMSAYQNKRNEAEYAKSQLEATAGIQIKGKNPLTNKANIETELKKGCIESLRMYTTHWLENRLSTIFPNPWPIVSNPDLTKAEGWDPDLGPQTLRFHSQATHGKYIAFMEECFEWPNMTYKFHPYYWANNTKWKTLVNLQDNDPLFESFLKAGSSTVVVPVRPGYEKLFAYYLNTGKLWFGEDVPLTSALNDFLGTIDTDPSEAPDVEACWNIKLPTNLVVLQKQDGGLDETGLPCFKLSCECETDECSCDEDCE